MSTVDLLSVSVTLGVVVVVDEARRAVVARRALTVGWREREERSQRITWILTWELSSKIRKMNIFTMMTNSRTFININVLKNLSLNKSDTSGKLCLFVFK